MVMQRQQPRWDKRLDNYNFASGWAPAGNADEEDLLDLTRNQHPALALAPNPRPRDQSRPSSAGYSGRDSSRFSRGGAGGSGSNRGGMAGSGSNGRRHSIMSSTSRSNARWDKDLSDFSFASGWAPPTEQSDDLDLTNKLHPALIASSSGNGGVANGSVNGNAMMRAPSSARPSSSSQYRSGNGANGSRAPSAKRWDKDLEGLTFASGWSPPKNGIDELDLTRNMHPALVDVSTTPREPPRSFGNRHSPEDLIRFDDDDDVVPVPARRRSPPPGLVRERSRNPAPRPAPRPASGSGDYSRSKSRSRSTHLQQPPAAYNSAASYYGGNGSLMDDDSDMIPRKEAPTQNISRPRADDTSHRAKRAGSFLEPPVSPVESKIVASASAPMIPSLSMLGPAVVDENGDSMMEEGNASRNEPPTYDAIEAYGEVPPPPPEPEPMPTYDPADVYGLPSRPKQQTVNGGTVEEEDVILRNWNRAKKMKKIRHEINIATKSTTDEFAVASDDTGLPTKASDDLKSIFRHLLDVEKRGELQCHYPVPYLGQELEVPFHRNDDPVMWARAVRLAWLDNSSLALEWENEAIQTLLSL